jgi:putative Mn2+ efflux pump MntP
VLELLLLAVGLAMDASAVAAATALSHPTAPLRRGAGMALVFGVFQGLMPCLGWILGSRLSGWASRATPWIAFVILVVLGLRMIRGALRARDAEDAVEAKRSPFALRTLLALGVATSLDALAVGVTLPLLKVAIVACALVIGAVTFILATLAFQLGRGLGAKVGARFEIVGGIVLIGVGTKLLAAHLLA